MAALFTCYNRKKPRDDLAAREKPSGRSTVFSIIPRLKHDTGIKGIRDGVTRTSKAIFPAPRLSGNTSQDEFVCLVAAAIIPIAFKDMDHEPLCCSENRAVQEECRAP